MGGGGEPVDGGHPLGRAHLSSLGVSRGGALDARSFLYEVGLDDVQDRHRLELVSRAKSDVVTDCVELALQCASARALAFDFAAVDGTALWPDTDHEFSYAA